MVDASPAAMHKTVPIHFLIAALLGTFNQWARFTYFGEDPSPPAEAANALYATALKLLS